MKTWLFPLWIIISVLLGLASVALWVAAPEYKTLNWALTIFTVALEVLLCFVKTKEIKVFMKSSYFKHAAFHSVNVLLIVSIVAVVNYLGNKNYREFDLTTQKRNTLADQTKKILEMVKRPLTLTVFAKREDWHPILNVLRLFEAQNKLIQLKAIDTDLRPDLVKAKGVTQNGTVIINYDNKETSFVISDELSVTNALLKALRQESITLYVVTGHQELSCSEQSPEGFSFLCEKLKTQNYVVKTLDLTQTTSVPKDATAVLVLGPISGYLPQEVAQLDDYLKKGGSMFLALAPAFKKQLYDNLVALAAPYGLVLGNDMVIDRLSTVQGAEATIPIVTSYDSQHAITSGFTQRTIFPLSSSVDTLKGFDSATLLAFSSHFPGSWAETDMEGVVKGKAQYNEKTDKKGPVGLMGAGERLHSDAPRDSRFVLLGSSSFLINAYQSQSGNTTLFLNALSWLVEDEGIISFNRPGIEESPVILSAQHLQMIFVISILVVPIIFFGCAIFIYRRRRLL